MIAAEEKEFFTFLVNNELRVITSSDETGAYTVVEMIIQPGGGGNTLHTDPFLETFFAVEGEFEVTRDIGGQLVTSQLRPGQSVSIPHGQKHKFVGAGNRPGRVISVGLPGYDKLFMALAEAWPAPQGWDPERTPAAVGPVFERFGVRFFE
ncbi:MAG: cupin domain-containing protein [Candidatus Dormibacteria bacterium]